MQDRHRGIGRSWGEAEEGREVPVLEDPHHRAEGRTKGEPVAEQARTGCRMLPVNRNSRMKVVTTISAPASSRWELIACFASMRVAVAPPMSTVVPTGADTARTCLTRSCAPPEAASSPVLRLTRWEVG
jgi:hypothetical protein